MRKVLTLCLVIQDGNILLGMKKRGFGVGKWNGFGGKVESGETIEEAAKRETLEECGIVIRNMEQVAINEFQFENKMEEILEVHVFRADTFSGEPIETEEMRPEWFAFADIPYDTMWPDDRFWMPIFLSGKKFRTKFLFGAGDVILEKEILKVKNLDDIG
ncbi:MAG: 8-oxo-dGTP diphosphatase [Candidatus Moranbacteria bacterium]|nr:8-oxo-dGTP diphosphatase [Candidatus Moranbacteria bacterium]